jgi:hypothetical protein
MIFTGLIMGHPKSGSVILKALATTRVIGKSLNEYFIFALARLTLKTGEVNFCSFYFRKIDYYLHEILIWKNKLFSHYFVY